MEIAPRARALSRLISPERETREGPEAAALFCGRHDFSAFRNTGSAVRDPVRTVFRCELEQAGDELRLYVCADGFLYNMVRVIAGTLLCVGKGKLSPSDVSALFASRRRAESGMTAPPQGLALCRLWYDGFRFAPHESLPDRIRPAEGF